METQIVYEPPVPTPTTPPAREKLALPSLFDAMIDIIAERVKEKLGTTQSAPTSTNCQSIMASDAFKTELDRVVNNKVRFELDERLESLVRDEVENNSSIATKDYVDDKIDGIDISDKVREEVQNLTFSVSVD